MMNIRLINLNIENNNAEIGGGIFYEGNVIINEDSII